ncbi:MAG: T9SS type A sorting domain-containing protein [Lewinellaceae bacterium]|nr:T9SS type A sorting domain-containing protein [Lewinellaceae bacterium]
MKNRLIRLSTLSVLFFLNPLFFTPAWATDTYVWIGGYSNNWEDEQNWRNMDTQVDGELPVDDSDIMIDGNVTVTLSSAIITESIQLSGGATLIVAVGGSISTTEGGLNGSNSIRLDEVSPYPYPPATEPPPNPLYTPYLTGSGPCALFVHGALYLNNDNANGSGLLISTNTSVTVANTGSVFISNAGTKDEAIRVRGGSLTNNGAISLTNPGEFGIRTSTGSNEYLIVNNGTLTISGGKTGMDLGSVWMENHGTVTVSGTSAKLLDGDGRFRNYGTFGGNGTVEADDFIPEPGSTISPGTSIGTLTFDNDLNLSGVTLYIEINASNSYDRINVQGAATLTGGTLSFGGTHSPLNGEEYLVVHSTTNEIIGQFSSPTETDPVTLNGSTFNISYTGNVAADVNILISNSSALPVELIHFTARSAGKTVQLAWATATETNNDYFSIEHSADGRHFKEIGRLSGAGASQEKHDYAFVDNAPEKGLNYYRLAQYDFDGAREYSPVQTAFFEGDKSWTVYSTLASEVIMFEWTETPDPKARVEVFNLSGQRMYAQEGTAQSTTLQIPVGDWVPGMYWVMVRNKGKVEAQWLMIFDF